MEKKTIFLIGGVLGLSAIVYFIYKKKGRQLAQEMQHQMDLNQQHLQQEDAKDAKREKQDAVDEFAAFQEKYLKTYYGMGIDGVSKWLNCQNDSLDKISANDLKKLNKALYNYILNDDYDNTLSVKDYNELRRIRDNYPDLIFSDNPCNSLCKDTRGQVFMTSSWDKATNNPNCGAGNTLIKRGVDQGASANASASLSYFGGYKNIDKQQAHNEMIAYVNQRLSATDSSRSKFFDNIKDQFDWENHTAYLL